MKKLSKQSIQIVKNMMGELAEKEGVTPKAVQTILDLVSKSDFTLLTEYEAAILSTAIKNQKILESYPEIFALYQQIEVIWAMRARQNGSRVPKSYLRVLH